MSKYSFERMGAEKFEQLGQALLENLFRIEGGLIQFGAGKDGAREAVWTQVSTHSTYKRPSNEESDADKKWVFQVKFHDIGLRGWTGARSSIQSELESELNKVVDKYELGCHKYILITNIPFSGVRYTGTRDVIDSIRESWASKIPEIEIWDANDISRMLDSCPGVRTAFLETILPGDILSEILLNLRREQNKTAKILRGYLQAIVDAEIHARSEEAGDDGGLKLDRVYVDLNLKLDSEDLSIKFQEVYSGIHKDILRVAKNGQENRPVSEDSIPSSLILLQFNLDSCVIKGGPGVGKSTISQFLALYHASRIVDPPVAKRLEKRLKAREFSDEDFLEHTTPLVIPFRVELRRYAQWLSEKDEGGQRLSLYLAERVGRFAGGDFSEDQFFDSIRSSDILLMLDGLDEVPNRQTRQQIFSELKTFLLRASNESVVTKLLMTTRPQGYRGEFEGFDPISWTVNDLDKSDFDDYSTRWLNERISDQDERDDARQRISQGMASPAVRDLAKTLLQVTVMLTIAKRKQAIPHARHALFERYVDVIFEREKQKEAVRNHENPLRMLHEDIGFRIISKFEDNRTEAILGPEEFESCVANAIKNYGGREIGENTISAVVNSITQLAKDRLCLLSGKGEQQENVDFVIQTFREYFAASFFANHEEAIPDKVLESLQLRQNVWMNVLQFYSGFQPVAVQRNWVCDSDGTGLPEGEIETTLALVRKRRCLLKMLPEFERLRNDYIERAFRNVFAKDTRWTWGSRDEVGSLVSSFCPDITFLEAVDWLGVDMQNVSSSPDDFDVSLRILTEIPTVRRATDFREFVISCAGDERVRSMALCAVASAGIALPRSVLEVLTGEELSLLVRANPRLEFLEIFREFNAEERLEVMLRSHFRGIEFPQGSHKEAEILTIIVRRLATNATIAAPRIHLSAKAFLIQRTGLDIDSLIPEEDGGNLVMNYIRSLFQAINNPFSFSAFSDASDKWHSVSHKLSEWLSPLEQLGNIEPYSDSDVSDEEMKLFRQDCVIVKEAWLNNISVDDRTWVTVLCHPKDWPFLVPYIGEEVVSRMISKISDPLSRVIGVGGLVDYIDVIFAESHPLPDPFLLVSCLLDIHEKGEFVIFDNLFSSGGQYTKYEINSYQYSELIERALKNPHVPSSLSSLIFRMAYSVDNLDVVQFGKFWRANRFDAGMWLGRRRNQPEVVDRIIATPGFEPEVAAFFVGTEGEVNRESEILMVKGILGKFAHVSGDEIEIAFSSLEYLSPTDDEIEFWADPEHLEYVKGVWNVEDRVANRILRLISTADIGDQLRVVSALKSVVSNRRDFPGVVAIAALDTLIQLEETFVGKLDESHWQA